MRIFHFLRREHFNRELVFCVLLIGRHHRHPSDIGTVGAAGGFSDKKRSHLNYYNKMFEIETISYNVYVDMVNDQ